jgi:hypothetical protein
MKSPDPQGGVSVTPDFTRLPPVIRLEDMIAEVDVRPVPDPQGSVDSERGFMLRYAG